MSDLVTASDPLPRPTADARSISELVAAARAGTLRIPPFQRRFRWGGTDIERLFESIWKGYPIGSLLLWERAAPATVIEFGPLQVEARAQTEALFVVDGQQRLTSLVGVLAAPEGVRGPFELYFDLATQQFRRAGSRRPPASWLPLRLAIDTNALLSWLLAFRAQGGGEELVQTATVLGNRLSDYRIPVSIVRTDDESVLRDIFDRMNTFGRRLTKAEVFQALHAVSGQKDPHDLTDLGSAVDVLGFGSLREDTILRAVLAVRGGDPFRDFRREFDDGSDPAETYDRTSHALQRTVHFLQGDVGIPHVRALPYALVIPVLVRFFDLHPAPTPRTRVLLRRWVWRAAVAGIGGGSGTTATLRRMVQGLDGDEDASAQRLLAEVGPFPARPLDLRATQLNRAAARANVALLSTLSPLDLETGDPIDVAQVLDDPSGLLRVPAASGRVESLASVLLHPAISDDAIEGLIGEATPDALASHGVPQEAVDQLVDGDVDGFLALRLARLQELLDSRILALAEPTASDRPSISSLVVADDVG